MRFGTWHRPVYRVKCPKCNPKKQVHPILEQYDWGTYHLFAIYPQQQTLPERTRLFLDFIFVHTKALLSDTTLHNKPPRTMHSKPI